MTKQGKRVRDKKTIIRELANVIADAMIQYGPDGHCDGANEIAWIVLKWCRKNKAKL